MKHSRRAVLMGVLVSALFCSPLLAQNLEIHIYLDNRNPAAGCEVDLPALSVTLEELDVKVTAFVDREASTVVAVESAFCDGAGFGPTTQLGGGYPVALNSGLNGSDAVELAAEISGLDSFDPGARLFVVSYNPDTGSQDLLGPGGFQSPPGISAPIPAFGNPALFVLAVILLLAGTLILRRNPALLTVSLVAIAAAAAAVNYMADGNLDDWAGESPSATDDAGDSIPPDPATDLIALFAALESGQAFFRADLGDIENQAPIADALSANTSEDTAVTVTLSGTDADGDPLTFSIDTPPDNGTLGAITAVDDTSATVEYLPDPDFNGNDTFSYVASDGSADSAPATVDITVDAQNDPPTANDDEVTLDEDSPESNLNVLDNDSIAPDTGETLSITAVGVPDNGGTANNNTTTIGYTPGADFFGTETFTYEISDGNGGTDSATVTVTVINVNDDPTAADDSFTVSPDSSDNTLDVLDNDSFAPDEGETLSISAVGATDNGGSVVNNGTDLSYTPLTGFSGTETFTYDIDDGNGGSDSALVSVTVSPPEADLSISKTDDVDPIVAGEILSYTITVANAGPQDAGNVVVTDTLPAGVTLVSTSACAEDPNGVPACSLGTITAGDSQMLTIQVTVDPTTAGTITNTASVASDVTDPNAADNTASQDTTVDALNNPPELDPIGNQTINEETLLSFTATATDSDLPAQTLTFSLSGEPAGASITTAGVFSWTPTEAQGPGMYTFDVIVTDSGAPPKNDFETITVTVNEVNQPPIANDESFNVQSNVGISANAADGLLNNDSDTEGAVSMAAASIGTFTTSNGGSITVLADGSFTFTPQAGDTGVADTFAYTIEDTAAATANATATFNVDANTIWFVDLVGAPGGDGTLGAPFDSLADLDNGGPDANGSTIFHYTSDGSTQTDLLSDDFDLQDNQFLIGEGVSGAGTINDLRGFTTHPFSLSLPAIGAALNHAIASTANGGITLASGNTLRGVDIGDTDSGTGLNGTAFGTLAIDEVSILGTGGVLNLNNGVVSDPTGGATFDSLASTSNPGTGIVLNAVGGSFTVGTTTAITGGTLGIDIDGTSGSLDFGTTTIGGGIDAGIDILSSAAGTFSFDALSITTDAGDGLRASSGGTLNIAGAGNAISTVGGAGIDLSGTDLGGGFTLASLTANGASLAGIRLVNNTNAAITVTGATTINNAGSAGKGIELTNAVGGQVVIVNLQGTVDIDTSSGIGIDLDGSGGTATELTVIGAGSSVLAGGAQAIDLDNASTNIAFSSISSTNSAAEGIDINGLVGGSIFNGGATTITNAAAVGIDINTVGASSDIDFGTTAINDRNSTGIFASAVTGGTVDFGATTISNPNSVAGYGIRLDDSSAVFTFASTTISATVQSAATIDGTTDGIPDNDGDGDAIFLSNLTGGFTVNGGTLSALAADGIDARNSANLTLRNLAITDIGLTSTSAASIPDAGLFAYNLSGANLLQNVTIDNAQTLNQSEEHVHVFNNGVSFDELRLSNVDIENSTVGTGSATVQGSNGFSFETRGVVNGSIVVEDGSDATGIRLNAYRFAIGDGSGGSGTINIVVDQSTMDANGLEVISGGLIQIGVANDIALLVQDDYTVNYTLSNSVLRNSRTGYVSGTFFAGAVVGEISNAVTPDLTARFHDNLIQDVRGRAGMGLIQELEAGDLSFTAHNNSVQDMEDETISGANFFVGEAARAVLRADANSNRPELRFVNNAFGTVTPIAGSGSQEGIFLQPRLLLHTSEIVIEGNTIVNSATGSGEAIEVDVEDQAVTHLTLTDNSLTGGNQNEGFTAETEDLPSMATMAAKGNDLNGDELQFDQGLGTMTILDRDNLGADNSNLTVSLVGSPGTTGTPPDLADPEIIPSNGVNTQMTTVSTAYTNLEVLVLDAGGNPANGVTVTFTAPGAGASVTFPSGNTAVTGGSGMASVPATANATAGAFTVTATATVGGDPADAGHFHLLNTQ